MDEFKVCKAKIKKYTENRYQVKIYSYEYRYDFEKNPDAEKIIENDFNDIESLDEAFAKAKRSIKSSKNRAINKIYDYARTNDWEYFVTLTFNPDKVDSFNYDDCSSCVSQWLENVKRRYSPDLQYLVVPELHKSGRYHFHALFNNIGNLPLSDSGITDKLGGIIYNIDCYKNGFTTASKIKSKDKASSYIAKYISKELSGHIKGKKHYWRSRGLKCPDERKLTINDLINMGLTKKILSASADYEKTVNYDIGTFSRSVDYYEISDETLCTLLGQTNDFVQET